MTRHEMTRHTGGLCMVLSEDVQAGRIGVGDRDSNLPESRLTSLSSCEKYSPVVPQIRDVHSGPRRRIRNHGTRALRLSGNCGASEIGCSLRAPSPHLWRSNDRLSEVGVTPVGPF